MLKRCPSHKFLDMDIMQAFITGLKSDTQMLVDAYGGGTMKIKTAREVRELIVNMSLDEYRALTDEKVSLKKKGIIDLNTHDTLLASNKLLSLQLETEGEKNTRI